MKNYIIIFLSSLLIISCTSLNTKISPEYVGLWLGDGNKYIMLSLNNTYTFFWPHLIDPPETGTYVYDTQNNTLILVNTAQLSTVWNIKLSGSILQLIDFANSTYTFIKDITPNDNDIT